MTTTNDPALDALTKYTWEPQPKAAAFVKKVVDDFLEKLPEAKAFAERLYRETGNRFGDLIDEIHLKPSSNLIRHARLAGWVDDDSPVLVQKAGMFPLLIRDLPEEKSAELVIDLKVESVIDFLLANDIQHQAEDDAGNRIRRRDVAVGDEGKVTMRVVEKHGRRHDFDNKCESLDPRGFLDRGQMWWMQWFTDAVRARPRVQTDYGERDWGALRSAVDVAIEEIGRDRACDIFFAAEREYWQRRNTAAQFQKARQDRLGIGWANHDHHTYRSSRRHFHRLVALWEKLGFECRERFYPGPEAGWGAQVMEQPVCGIVTFNDVDISPDELLMDFAHEPMQERNSLGTVGLWCALHGESVLQAGMHHLECTFDFDALEQQMASEGGIKTMKRFTDFPYLKQAFTQGERWKVDPARIDKLLEQGLINSEQAENFRVNGAIGSHLENLERNDGFKGFNQTGVTEIIHATDPRKQRGE